MFQLVFFFVSSRSIEGGHWNNGVNKGGDETKVELLYVWNIKKIGIPVLIGQLHFPWSLPTFTEVYIVWAKCCGIDFAVVCQCWLAGWFWVMRSTVGEERFGVAGTLQFLSIGRCFCSSSWGKKGSFRFDIVMKQSLSKSHWTGAQDHPSQEFRGQDRLKSRSHRGLSNVSRPTTCNRTASPMNVESKDSNPFPTPKPLVVANDNLNLNLNWNE